MSETGEGPGPHEEDFQRKPQTIGDALGRAAEIADLEKVFKLPAREASFQPALDFDLDEAVFDTKKVKDELMKKANEEKKELDASSEQKHNTATKRRRSKKHLHPSQDPHEKREKKRKKRKDKRSGHNRNKLANKYDLPNVIEEESHLPDRAPKLDPNLQENFKNAIITIFERHNGNPEQVTLVDLKTILEAERKDLADQEESYSRLASAIPVAKEYLMNKKNPRNVNVTVYKNEDGEWVASVGAEKGKLYLSFTGSRIIDARTEIIKWFTKLNMIDDAEAALDKLINNKDLNEYSEEAQALYSYLNGNKAVLMAQKTKIKDNDLLQAADLEIAFFDSLLKRVEDCKTTVPDASE